MSALLDALGFVGDAIGRPGQAVRGLLAGRPDQALRLLPGAESLGLVGEGDATSGRDLLQQWGVMDKDDSWGNWGAGLAAEVVTDPLTYFGGSLARRALGGMRAAPAADDAAGLLGKRRGFGMVEVTPQEVGLPDVRRLGGEIGNWDAKEIGRQLTEKGYQGAYSPQLNAGAVEAGSQPFVRRHEVMHGLVDQARKTGDTSGLGPIAKAAVWMDDGTRPAGLRMGLGAMLDETAAHAAEARGLMGQTRNAAGFLFGGAPEYRSQYADLLRQASPAVANLYRGMGYVPTVGKYGAAAGGVGAGVYGGSALAEALGV
jgi:hypothetical protein